MKVQENDQNDDIYEYDGLDVHFDRVILVSVFDLNNVANPSKAFTLLQPDRTAVAKLELESVENWNTCCG